MTGLPIRFFNLLYDRWAEVVLRLVQHLELVGVALAMAVGIGFGLGLGLVAAPQVGAGSADDG